MALLKVIRRVLQKSSLKSNMYVPRYVTLGWSPLREKKTRKEL